MQATSFPSHWLRSAALAALLALAAVCLAATTSGGGNNCPDSGIKIIPSKISYGPVQSCGTGLGVTTGGVTVNAPKLSCPTFAIYEPPYHAPMHKVGFRSFAGAKLPITVFTFQCNTRWFVFFPIGSECVPTGQKNTGSVQNYVQAACGGRNEREPGHNNGRGKIGGR